jgi:hypothetical protein
VSGPRIDRWIVTSQSCADWPAKDYAFTIKAEALMFLYYCKREGDYRTELRGVAA